MTDADHAAILRRYQPGPGVPANPDWADYDAAVERAIEVLEPCSQCGACLIVHVCHTGVPL